MNRSAPAEGYDFGNKRQYRREVWSAFTRFCAGRVGASSAFLMPSAEGDEIDVALAKGFKQERLHVCDHNPAIVAVLKRRYPKINTYGVDCVQAFQRMADRGITIDVANLDLCGQVSHKCLKTLSEAAAENVLAPHSAVAVTVLRGRESGWPEVVGNTTSDMTSTSHLSRFRDDSLSAIVLRQVIDRFDGNPKMVFSELSRVWHIAIALGLGSRWDPSVLRDATGSICRQYVGSSDQVLPIRHGVYRSTSGTQTMAWVIYYRTPPSSMFEKSHIHALLTQKLVSQFEAACREGRMARLIRSEQRSLFSKGVNGHVH